MPDVIIKGMEMPESCEDCQISKTGLFYRWCGIDIPGISNDVEGHMDSRPDWCPLSSAPEWISVEEMPPPNDTAIQLLINRRYQVVAKIRKGEWVLSWTFEPIGLDSTDVLHWMPLPEPPEGGDGDG